MALLFSRGVLASSDSSSLLSPDADRNRRPPGPPSRSIGAGEIDPRYRCGYNARARLGYLLEQVMVLCSVVILIDVNGFS